MKIRILSYEFKITLSKVDTIMGFSRERKQLQRKTEDEYLLPKVSLSEKKKKRGGVSIKDLVLLLLKLNKPPSSRTIESVIESKVNTCK